MTLKDRIIDESLKLFSVKGYINTSTTDIITAAGTLQGRFLQPLQNQGRALHHGPLRAPEDLGARRTSPASTAVEHPVDRLQSSWRTTATATWPTRTPSPAAASS